MLRLLVAFLLLTACSSSSSLAAPHDAGDRDASSASDAASVDGGSPCPSAAPSSGACGPQGLACEYGTAAVSECDTVATCNGGRWEVTMPTPGDAVCVSGSPPACAASMSAVPVGQHCTPLDLECDFPTGRCACTVRMSPTVTDASAQATWICPDLAQGCPAPRPRLGTPCSHEGLGCDYGACAIPGAGFETCTGGAWVEGSVSCP